MVTEPEDKLRGSPGQTEQGELLSPLTREAVDWESVYRTYRKLPTCERQVLDLLVGRQEPKQVARALGVSWNTVRNQIRSLRTRFEADSVQELSLMVAIALYEEALRYRNSRSE